MFKVIVFAGTTEGYELSRYLADHETAVLCCVATEYGAKSLSENEYLKISYGRLDQEAMEKLLDREKPELVLDATHPYAPLVTGNLKSACLHQKVDYLRVLREGLDEETMDSHRQGVVCVADTQEAISFLEHTQGNIFLTTGSKELASYTQLTGFKERVYARVLSLPQVLETCRELGIEGKHLIGMQGPFSRELNEAMLRQYDCRYLVTKDTGREGGFEEKIEAAIACQVTAVVIGRPFQVEGISLAECKKELIRRFSLKVIPRIALIGIGMGSGGTLTEAAREELKRAELVIGARRMADAVATVGQALVYEYRSEEIMKQIKAHPECERIAVVLSGDIGFYSGARKLREALCGFPCTLEVLCGVSSVNYFMAKAGLSWDDAVITSVHGRNSNLVSLMVHHEKVFAILGTQDGVSSLARRLTEYGWGNIVLYVGEKLSYEDEKIFHAPAFELTEYQSDPLSVVCSLNQYYIPLRATHGLPDGVFERGKAPMTKEEIRAVSLSKLRLYQDSICYDVGAGTGSVSVEMALRCDQGCVYAIEKKPEALELIEKNKRKFAVDNLEIIPGQAPEVLENLPAPTHAFIGGSSGNLGRIVALLREKNPEVRLVINCITLETLTETLAVLKSLGFEKEEIVSVTTARSKSVGSYHMMMGENPIYIVTCQ
ncbi:MAG: precorrin-6A reductase [Blautia sp.]|nr:precorrin-6A reductase [Blautia sp.]